MRHHARIDWWIAAAIMVAIVVPAAEEHYWIAAMPLLILLSCCAPQSYETTGQGLLIRAGLVRRLIPYRDITFVGPGTDGRYSLGLSLQQVKIHYGKGCELAISPANPEAFCADMQARAPHLRRYGRNLVLAFA